MSVPQSWLVETKNEGEKCTAGARPAELRLTPMHKDVQFRRRVNSGVPLRSLVMFFYITYPSNRPGNFDWLIQRPPLQQLGYLPASLHPLLECYVFRIRALSHLDQIIGEND